MKPKAADPLLLLGRNGLKYLRSPECKLVKGTRVHPYRVIQASIDGRTKSISRRSWLVDSTSSVGAHTSH